MSVRKQYTKYITQNEYKRRLTLEEEQILFRQYREENDIEAKNKILFASYGLIHEIVRNHNYCKSLTWEDLYQQCIVILIETIDKFNYNRGLKFSSYLIVALNNQLRRYINTFDKVLRLPDRVCNTFVKISTVIEKLNNLNEDITLENINKHINGKIDEKMFNLYKIHCNNTISLDNDVSVIDTKQRTGLDVLICDPIFESDIENVELMDTIKNIINNMDYETKTVMIDHYLNEKDTAFISNKLNISPKTVRSRKNKGLRILKVDKKIKEYLELLM